GRVAARDVSDCRVGPGPAIRLNNSQTASTPGAEKYVGFAGNVGKIGADGNVYAKIRSCRRVGGAEEVQTLRHIQLHYNCSVRCGASGDGAGSKRGREEALSSAGASTDGIPVAIVKGRR